TRSWLTFLIGVHAETSPSVKLVRFREALALAETDGAQKANAHRLLASTITDSAEALEHADTAITLYRDAGWHRQHIQTLSRKAELLAEQGAMDEAVQCYLDAIDIAITTDASAVNRIWKALVDVATWHQWSPRALRLLAAATNQENETRENGEKHLLDAA